MFTKIGLTSLLFVLIVNVSVAETVEVTINTMDVKGEISPMLTGVNMSWYYDTDAIWADGSMAASLKAIRSGILRYPGGCETSLFHWERPYGCLGGWPCGDTAVDYWNPATNPDDYPSDERYMDTDDYINQCRAIGAEPMLGVNLQSGLKYNRLQDSIDEAVRWVQYCKDKNYGVKYWYLDNEPYYHANCDPMTAAEYAGYIKQFSTAMKQVDPNLKMIIGWENKLSVEKYWDDWKTLITEAGDKFDIGDVHWYWAWGYATWDLWLNDTPMKVREWCEDCPDQRYIGPSYVGDIQGFYEKLNAISGVNHNIKLAALEWNIGPVKDGRFSKFQHALMQAEMLGQFIEGGLHMACIWPLTWSGGLDADFNTVLDQDVHQPTPSLEVFRMYSKMLGQKLVTSETTLPAIRSIAALSQDGNTLWVALLRKSNPGEPLDVHVTANDFPVRTVQAQTFTANNLAGDEWKTLPISIERVPDTTAYTVALPPHSLTLITMRSVNEYVSMSSLPTCAWSLDEPKMGNTCLSQLR